MFSEFLFSVPQGSILELLFLFNIYICDIFVKNSDIDIDNYADDNTPYVCLSDLDCVVFKLNTPKTFSDGFKIKT